MKHIPAVVLVIGGCCTAYAEDVASHGGPAAKVPWIQPWKQVALDPDYSGAWVVTGDIDGDGQAEIVSARNVNVGDVHYTITAPYKVYVFRNEKGRKPEARTALGCGTNFTLY